ncbi:MAG: HD domain-containing protein [Bacteroidales bacterium]|nr:HD domain-containing protein [Bacteroidales bacterium]NCU35646.1 bifunctional (p)ppGpp synthetase/guanosine-3',5'-bis(diphosphate) 3'-pyrophosphohydrolase [Candidatus Falkowbacteria bacterium]
MIEADEKEIAAKFEKLKRSCAGCTTTDYSKLDHAFAYARNLYGDQLHENGEPKILQSINVATIVSAEIGLQLISVIAALLHDAIENFTDDTSELEAQVGPEVSAIVKGFKKISAIHSEKVSLQSENFRKLFLSTVDDVRVIFIKMAHRLYDMRNYHRLPDRFKKWFLDDVQYLYIPIAHRLGLYQIKAELEDHAFRYTNPMDYTMIASHLKESKLEQERYIEKFAKPIIGVLEQEKIPFEIKSRTKTITSIKKKIDVQGVDIDQVYDLFAVRLILTGCMTAEDENFVAEFQHNLETYGDPRQMRRARREKGSETSGTDHNGDVTDDLAAEEALKQVELKNFEERRKRYVALMDSEKTACWRVYSLITNIYTPNPKRLRDWISTPKTSGYESLHTTVLGPSDRYVEVQIRTRRMDEEAEKGVAAHWRYKESAYGKNVDAWMNDVRNVLENLGARQLDHGSASKIHINSDKIYVFTREGDLRELRTGATILDFAFDIHTDVGSKCTGGKVNGKVVPIRHELQNGDKVEIITSKRQKPNIDWLKYVVTSKAKARINRALREDKFKEAEHGKESLMRKFKNWKIDFSDQNINKVTKHYGFQKPIDLYFQIATGKVDLLEVKHLFSEPEETSLKSQTDNGNFELTEELIESQSEKDQGFILIEAGVTNLNYSLAKCCNPIAGDRIFGFVTVNHGIKIHRYDCPNASQLLEKYPYRIIRSRWKESMSRHFFTSNLRILGLDRMGLLNDITKVITNDLKVNLKGMSFKTEGSNFEGNVKVQVRDVEHLAFLKLKLLKIKGVTRVVRFE